MPMGIGLKFKANLYLDLFIEGNYRFTFSDYLDDVSAFDISGFMKSWSKIIFPEKTLIGFGFQLGKNDFYFQMENQI